MDAGTEIRLFDPKREPRDWTGLISGTQCAVFLADVTTSEPLSREGKPFGNAADATCILFGSLDAAQRFCEAKVEERPDIRCEVFDVHGRAHPPLAVVIHPRREGLDAPGPAWSRRRRWIAALLLAGAAPLFWIGWRSRGETILPVFLSLGLFIVALRFLHWDFGLEQARRNRERRAETHRRREQAGRKD